MEDVPYGRILREGWIIILISALLGAGIAWGVTKLLPETYAATSTLILQVDSAEASLFERNQFSLARIKSYPALVDSPEVVDAIRRDIGVSEDEYSDRDLRRMLSAENTTDTVLLVVRADAPTAEMAAAMANSAAGHLSRVIEETENEGADDRYVVSLDQVLPAVEPLAPISPQVLAITGLGLIAGIAIGAIIAVYRTTTNRHLVTIADIRRASGLPVIGQIPGSPRLPIARQQAAAKAAAAAAYEDTIGNIAALGGTALTRFALIPASADGIDEEALSGMLDAFAGAGRNVCVLDTRPGRQAAPGVKSLADALTDDDEADASVPDGGPASTIFARSSRIPSDTIEREIPATIARLGEEYDVVLVVCDPAASALVERVVALGTGVIVSVKHNSTTASDLVSVVTRLRVMGIRPLGVLMIHANSRAIGVVAESWRDSDRDIAGPRPPVEPVAVPATPAEAPAEQQPEPAPKPRTTTPKPQANRPSRPPRRPKPRTSPAASTQKDEADSPAASEADGGSDESAD